MASVRKRKKSKFWYACITLPDGKQTQFSTGLEDESEALAVARAAERATAKNHAAPHQLRAALDRLAEEFIPPEDVDPGPWLVTWAERRKAECSESTYEAYRHTMKEASAWLAENNVKAFSAFTPRHVTDMRDAWAAANSNGTANDKTKHLRIALKDAVTEKVIQDNPAANVAKLTTKKTRRRGFRPAEWDILMPALHGEWKAMVLLGLNTGGQRINDLAVLRQNAVDLSAKTVSFVTAKTDAVVCLPLMEATIQALLDLPSSDNPEAFLFPEIAQLAESSRSNRFIDILRTVGLAPKKVKWKAGAAKKTGPKTTSVLSFHSLRHTATSWLKSAGVSDSIARAIVGHESKAVSQIYTHIDIETMRAALEKMPLH